MSRSNPVNGVLAMFLVLIFMFVGSLYAMSIYSEHSQSVNVTNSSYAASYQTQQTEQGVTLTAMNLVEILVAFALVIVALKCYVF